MRVLSANRHFSLLFSANWNEGARTFRAFENMNGYILQNTRKYSSYYSRFGHIFMMTQRQIVDVLSIDLMLTVNF